MSSITVATIDFNDQPELLNGLIDSLRATFHCQVLQKGAWFDVEQAFDPARVQYNSTTLLGQLLQPPPPPGQRVLGITSVDIFIPILTFVFGEAQLDGQAAIVSTYRLRSEVYGMAGDDTLLRQRLEKEAIHELGHTYGLVHCRHPSCVMRSATYVEQIDLKDRGFCQACQAQVLRVIAE